MEKLSQWQKSFFEAQYGALLKVAFRYVSTYEQAVEMTYHGFIRIFEEVTRLKISQDMKSKAGLSAWVKRIFIITLVGKIKSELRLHAPRPIPGDIWQEPGGEANLGGVIAYIELIKILKGLPMAHRLVFNLHVIDGFSHAEIAKMLAITVKESKYNLLEAREYCKRSLEDIKPDTDTLENNPEYGKSF
jgi:RNA polymerase sigma factor (sigma-70 family)